MAASDGSKREIGLVASAPAFVGRQAALDSLVAAMSRPATLALVEGEAGIGKTRLLNEALAAQRDRVVLVAACPPLSVPFPLGPVVDGLRLLRQETGSLGMSRLGGALRPLFPEWVDDLPPALEPLGDSGETRHRLYRALTELIERLGVEVVVVEDAHWADSATLEWLLTLTVAESASGHRTRSIVMTYRPTDVPPDSPLLRLTSRSSAVQDKVRICVEPLEVGDVRLLVGSMLGTDEVSEQFAAFLADRTDGIPLALEETVRLLRERHDIIRQGGSWTRRTLDELDVPPTLRDSVLERLGRLDPEARAVLHAAAIVAEPAEEALLATVAELDEQAGRRGVAGSLAAGLLREVDGGRLTFRHALDAKAVAEAIPVSEQWRFHRRAAECLEKLDPQPVVRLARHSLRANDTEGWCRYAELSADVAVEAGDSSTAVRTLLDVLTTPDHPPQRLARLARKLGQAALYGLAPLGSLQAEAVDALRVALDEGDMPRAERGEIRVLLGELLHSHAGGRGAYEELEAAIDDLADRPDLACHAMLTLAMPLIPDWSAARHRRWLGRAAELIPAIEPPLKRVGFALSRATTLLLLGEESGWQAAAELPSAADLDDPRAGVPALLNIAQEALAWGRYGHARRFLTDASKIIATTEYHRFTNAVHVAEAYLDYYTGEWEQLDARVTELADAEETRLANRLEAQQLLGLLKIAGGARADGERELRAVSSEYARLGVAEPIAVLSPAVLGRLRLIDGAPGDAVREIAPVMEMIVRKGLWVWAADIAPVHVEALIVARRAPEAEALVQQFADALDGRDAAASAAALSVCRALIDGAHLPRAAADAFADAAKAWAAMPRPYDELLTLERQGRCLLRTGDTEAGLAVLSVVRKRLDILGAAWDADRVAQTLRRHGLDVRRTWRRGRRGYGGLLSPREIEVIELISQGMTNKLIAEALFISPKTVNQHVTASMRKLGVSSRTSLAMAASAAGLLTKSEQGT